MPKYAVTGIVSASKYLGIVEAANEEEAMEKGLNLDTAYVSLCWQCSDEAEDPQILEVVLSEAKDGD